jgi:hypothetical protein
MVEAAVRVDREPRPLRRIPSLVLNSPADPQTHEKDVEEIKRNKGDDVVPDSEEERLRFVHQNDHHSVCQLTCNVHMPRDTEGLHNISSFNIQPQVEVIEIFSSDENMYVLCALCSFQ